MTSTPLVQANNTYSQIELLVRRLTACSSNAALPSSDIQQQVNTFYNNDMPYSIKLDAMRSVYTFFTQPYVDRYPLDINYSQGVRAPAYVDGIQAFFYEDRDEFYRLWPRWPTKNNFSASAPLTGSITNITNATTAQVTSANHGLLSGWQITIAGVTGMTQINGGPYTITVVDQNNFTLNGINSTGFGAYSGGGTWTTYTPFFSFQVQGPFLALEVTIGGTDTFGNPISVSDDGYGNLWVQTPNPVVSVPAYGSQIPNPPPVYSPAPSGFPTPGLYNRNTQNPGLNLANNGTGLQLPCGTVNYVTGQFTFTLPTPLQSGTELTVWVSQYQTGRPYCILFWNNFFQIRPVPKLCHKIEIEVYMTPVQFMKTTDSPILNQWVQYISFGVSMEILRQRQDIEGVENLREGFLRQEALVLERQGVDEINNRNKTIFAGTQQNLGWNDGWNSGWY
jgi:hypothetical protein